MSQEYTQIGAAVGEALEHNATMAARHNEARADEERARREGSAITAPTQGGHDE